MTAALLKLLELIQRELGADDARIEIGGRDPTAPEVLWCPLPNGYRMVALFSTPPEQRGTLEERLRTLASSFMDLVEPLGERLAQLREPLARRLDEELRVLSQRASGLAAVVIDDSSPVIWGASHGRRGVEDVQVARRTAALELRATRYGFGLVDLLQDDSWASFLDGHGVADDLRGELLEYARNLSGRTHEDRQAYRREVLTARAIAAVRERVEQGARSLRASHQGDDLGYFTRPFGGIYQLIVVFAGAFSELHAEAAALHALPLVERLVMALPPLEPPPPGGRVITLRPPPR